MPQISATVREGVITAINKIRDKTNSGIKKAMSNPSASELSFSEIVSNLLDTHPEIVKNLPTTKKQQAQ